VNTRLAFVLVMTVSVAGASHVAMAIGAQPWRALHGHEPLSSSPYLNRRVIDATGLAGYFDGDFEFTTEIVMPPPPPGLPNAYDGRALPSIFSVLPLQLGLRLESMRGPVEILIVDHAERLTDD
jgi:uncharacterized protein (TIGR03435 family)